MPQCAILNTRTAARAIGPRGTFRPASVTLRACSRRACRTRGRCLERLLGYLPQLTASAAREAAAGATVTDFLSDGVRLSLSETARGQILCGSECCVLLARSVRPSPARS